jgi:hypothetical protein
MVMMLAVAAMLALPACSNKKEPVFNPSGSSEGGNMGGTGGTGSGSGMGSGGNGY